MIVEQNYLLCFFAWNYVLLVLCMTEETSNRGKKNLCFFINGEQQQKKHKKVASPGFEPETFSVLD